MREHAHAGEIKSNTSKYSGRDIQRMQITRAGILARQIISRLLTKWPTRKLEHAAESMQKEDDKGILYLYGNPS